MDLFSNLALGFSTATSLANLGFCLIGVLLGTLIGVLPGIGATATIAMLLPITFGWDFSKANLNVGRSLPARSGSGTLFMKLESPARARLAPLSAAVAPANTAARVRKSRR